MGRLNRRYALVTFAAIGAGVLAGGVPEVARRLRSDEDPGRASAPPRPRTTPTVPPDPSYAHGRPVRAVRRPVHTLHDLTPAAPPTAVALTIDDGPDPRWTPMLLDLLAEFHVPATFFLIGQQAREFPKLVHRMVAAGHQVADHTITHPMDLPSLSAAQMGEEIGGARDLIAQTTGSAPKWFRAPGGAWTDRILDTAATHDMICIDWEVDTRDWSRPGTQSIVGALLGAKAGDVLLCHDGGGDRSQTIQALRTAIPALQRRGLTFVAL